MKDRWQQYQRQDPSFGNPDEPPQGAVNMRGNPASATDPGAANPSFVKQFPGAFSPACVISSPAGIVFSIPPECSGACRSRLPGNLDPFRAAGNPLFNDNKLKLGIFGSNCSTACAMTLAETSFEPTWEKNVEIAHMLEAGGFECMVPIARWRGIGGATNFNGTPG
jgi:hypothetical protein